MSVVVEPLAGDPLDLAACVAIDEASFTRPSFDLREEAHRPIARVLIARFSPRDAPVGFLLAWAVADELHVLTVATHPEARRRGVGRALVRAAIDLARSSGARTLLLEVRRDNDAAIGLYRVEGFAITNVRRAYYADGADAIEMALRLDEHGAIVPSEDDLG